MKKQQIILSEKQLNQFIYAATKQVIAEITEATIKQAAMASGANTMSFRDYKNTHSSESEAKMNRADLIRLPMLTKALIDKFGNFKIKLVEHNINNHMSYVNYFIFDCVVLIDNNSCVLKGEISIGGRPYSVGYIRYDFNNQIWQRVRCGASLRVSEIAQLEPFHANLPLVDNIISTLQDYITYESQNIANAQNSTIIPSKARKPLSAKSKFNLYGDYLSAYRKKKATSPDEVL